MSNDQTPTLDGATIDQIAQAIEKTTRAMNSARTRFEAGETVYLAELGLDTQMRAIYAAVDHAEGAEVAERLLPPLRTLVETLDRLEIAVKAHAAKPAPVANARRATEAYGAAAPPRSPNH